MMDKDKDNMATLADHLDFGEPIVRTASSR